MLRLYKYVPPERIDVVRNLSIRFTPPGYLSDPFECRVAFPLGSSSRTTPLANPSISDEEKRIRLWRRIVSIQWGILCLTKRPDNLVMWAHYAAAHRGFLLEFDAENSFFTKSSVQHLDWTWMEEMPLSYPGFGNLRDVQYSEQRPTTMTSDEVPLDSFFVKSPNWAYEEEVRIILPLSDAAYKSEQRDMHLFTLPAEAITGVILGAGVTDEFTKEVKTLIGTEKLSHVKLQYAKLSLRTFGMEFTGG